MKKNIAIVGFGGQGGWHGDHALKSDVVSLAGIYDIKEARCEYARSKGIHVYESFEAVLADEKVDVVVCATPNDVHEDIVVRSLKAGKNVVCEKPVEMSVASLDRMIAAAEESGKLFTVHQNRRWDVDFLGMKKIIESGDIGEVINIESRIHGSRGIPSDWRCHKPYGGGMILDWGVHLIDQMLFLITSEIDTVTCNCTHITTDTYEVERPQSDVHDFYRNLVKAIDGIEPQLVTLPQVRRVMKVMEAAFKSDELGGIPVKFDEQA